MSPKPGDTLAKDPSAELTHEFNWADWLGEDAELASSSWFISGGDTGVGAPASVLVYDNASIVTGNKKAVLRLKAGTLNAKYTVTNRIVTNETPPQTDDRTIYIKIRNT